MKLKQIGVGTKEYVKVCSWVAEPDGIIWPYTNNARRIEAELKPFSELSWTYPDLHQLGISAEPDFSMTQYPERSWRTLNGTQKSLKRG